MVEEIIKFITNYISLEEDEIQFIKDLCLIETYKKNTILLSEGETAKECYFVLKGCIRSYFLIEGEERTTEFYTEQQAITPISYSTKQPSNYYLSCVEDTVVSLGRKNDLLIERIPRIKSLILQFNSEMLVQNQISFDNFKNFSPEMRYLNLLETRPDLLNRVPQYQLASYLGITPESLSRIRKRIISNQKSK